MKTDDSVTILREDYDMMVDQIEFLNCLRIVGVEYWEGFEEAQELYEEE